MTAKPNTRTISRRSGRASAKPDTPKIQIKVIHMRYRRSRIEGATYFFTVNTRNRRPFLCIPENVELLRQAFRHTLQQHPAQIEAIVLLPDHLHCIWTLPENDYNYLMRWRLIKRFFSRYCQDVYEGVVSKSRQSKRERAFWQRKFWEHTIRDNRDFIKHVEYITIQLNTV